MLGPVMHEILIVDDDGNNRAAYSMLLEEVGYQVREASDGHGCLAAVQVRVPALILLDVAMPNMDGFETLRRLRSAHKDIPVILVTGRRTDAESIESGLELGAEEFLQKPVRPDELKARIRALVHLAQARRELETLKRDQTAMLVHDLKQPLAIISLRAEFIADESADPELKKSGQVILDSCRQMERLVQSVLELSRVEAGQLTLKRQPTDLFELVEHTISPMRGLAERRGLRLELKLPKVSHKLHALSIDRNKLEQVLQNLIGNALKFTPAGGLIEVVLSEAGDEASIEVIDSGAGLSAAEAANVFDKWAQTQAGRAQGGSGLGLAIARAIVEAHGGKIGASARTDGQKGARFWLKLPVPHPASLALPDVAIGS